jgi:hypothetical protein
MVIILQIIATPVSSRPPSVFEALRLTKRAFVAENLKKC